MCKREPSKQAMKDALLSAISRHDDISGRPSGAKPRGREVPWDFEAGPARVRGDADAALVEMFERGTPIIGRKLF